MKTALTTIILFLVSTLTGHSQLKPELTQNGLGKTEAEIRSMWSMLYPTAEMTVKKEAYAIVATFQYDRYTYEYSISSKSYRITVMVKPSGYNIGAMMALQHRVELSKFATDQGAGCFIDWDRRHLYIQHDNSTTLEKRISGEMSEYYVYQVMGLRDK